MGRTLCPAGAVLPDRYNTILQSLEFIPDLLETNPGALCWGINFDRHIEPIKHPGQLVGRAKKTMLAAGLHPKHWKSVVRTETATMINLVTGAHSHAATAAHTLNALVQAKASPEYQKGFDPAQNPSLEGHVAQSIARDHFHPQATGSKHREAAHWGNLEAFAVILFKESFRTNEPYNSYHARQALDYVLEESRQGREIQSKSWRGLFERAERWHREQNTATYRKQWQEILTRQSGRMSCWDHHLPTDDDGQIIIEVEGDTYRVVPLLSQYMLYQESATLDHCVIGYGDQCVSGNTRIFSIREVKGKEPPGTLQIQTSGKEGWRNVQLRGPHNHPVSKKPLTH